VRDTLTALQHTDAAALRRGDGGRDWNSDSDSDSKQPSDWSGSGSESESDADADADAAGWRGLRFPHLIWKPAPAADAKGGGASGGGASGGGASGACSFAAPSESEEAPCTAEGPLQAQAQALCTTEAVPGGFTLGCLEDSGEGGLQEGSGGGGGGGGGDPYGRLRKASAPAIVMDRCRRPLTTNRALPGYQTVLQCS
jgi:hypothetical protein